MSRTSFTFSDIDKIKALFNEAMDNLVQSSSLKGSNDYDPDSIELVFEGNTVKAICHYGDNEIHAKITIYVHGTQHQSWIGRLDYVDTVGTIGTIVEGCSSDLGPVRVYTLVKPSPPPAPPVCADRTDL